MSSILLTLEVSPHIDQATLDKVGEVLKCEAWEFVSDSRVHIHFRGCGTTKQEAPQLDSGVINGL